MPLGHSLVLTGYFAYRILYQVYVYPIYVSPLRHLPGPPRGHWLWGQSANILRAEVGVLQREWFKKYGDKRGVIRAMGPIGFENMYFLGSEAMHKILVEDWIDYPRVSSFDLFSKIKECKIFKPDFMRKLLGIVAGFGLLTVTGETHRQMRKFMNPAFSLSNLMAREYWL